MKWKWLALVVVLLGAGVQAGLAQSASFTLDHNIFHPPADAQVTTTFTVPYGGNAKLVVYNSAGEVVKILYDGSVSAGATQTLTWDGKNLSGEEVASGVYVFRLKVDIGVQSKTLIVIR